MAPKFILVQTAIIDQVKQTKYGDSHADCDHCKHSRLPRIQIIAALDRLCFSLWREPISPELFRVSRIRTRIFQAWFRFSRPMTLGTRGIVENESGEVLLVRHTYTRGLYLPGGGVERGETVMQALIRELAEEAGVRPHSDPEMVGIYSNHRVFRNDHVVLFRIPAGGWRECETDCAGEISEALWVNPLFPPGDATPGTKRRLAEVFAGGPNDGHW